MQSIYAVYGSKLHLILDDDFATTYNRAQEAFFKAQSDHMERTGSQWDPSTPLMIQWTKKEEKVYNDFAKFMNHLSEINGGHLELFDNDEEIPSDYLVKQ